MNINFYSPLPFFHAYSKNIEFLNIVNLRNEPARI